MTVPPMSPPPPVPVPRRAPGPRLVTSLVTIGVGIVIAIVSGVLIALPLIGAFTSPAYAVPGDIQVHLRRARYTVYQRSGTKSTFGSVRSDPNAIRMDPSALSVRGPDGSTVPVSIDPDIETLTRGSNVYTGALVFDVPAGGEYVLSFQNRIPTTVVVARSLTDALHGALPWFGVGAFGGAVVIAGVVMLIVGATRRGRAKRAMYGGWGAPPPWGWPPPQWGPGGPQPPPGQWPPPPGPPPGQGPPPGPWSPPPPG